MQTTPVVQAMYYPFKSGDGNVPACLNVTDAVAPFASTIPTGTPYVKVGNTNADIQSAIMVKPVSVGVEANRAVFQ